MGIKEMEITEEQVQSFVAQSDCSILIMQKDLGDHVQNAINFNGSTVDRMKMIVILIESLARHLDTDPVTLSKAISLTVKMKQGLEDEDDDS